MARRRACRAYCSSILDMHTSCVPRMALAELWPPTSTPAILLSRVCEDRDAVSAGILEESNQQYAGGPGLIVHVHPHQIINTDAQRQREALQYASGGIALFARL